MPMGAGFSDEDEPAIHPALRVLILWLIGAVVASAGITPLWTPVLLGLLGLVIGESELWTDRLGWPDGAIALAPIAGLLICAWMVVGSLWAVAPQATLAHPLIFFAELGIVVALSSWFGRLPMRDRQAMLRPVMLGGAVAIAFLVFEILTHGLASGVLMVLLKHILSLDPTGIVVDDQGQATVSGFFFNRHVAACVLVLPAVLLATNTLLGGAVRRNLRRLLLLATGIILVMAESATAVLGFLAGALLYPLARWWPRAALSLIVGIFSVMLVLAPVLAVLPDRLGLGQAHWLPPSFRDRVGIWQWNADAIRQRSWSHGLLGIGLQGTQSLDAEWMQSHGNPDDKMGMPRPARHPHNGFLEVWSELGIVGVALMLVFGLATIGRIPRFARRAQPYLCTLAAAMLGVASTGWSLWQPWLLASLASGTLFLVWASLTDPLAPDVGAAVAASDAS